MKPVRERKAGERAFSLVEVVMALGICSFALIAIMGLFTTGLQSSKDSEAQMQAANLASLLISTRQASPTSDTNGLVNFAIPASAMTNRYTNAYINNVFTNFVRSDGLLTNLSSNPDYQISCRAGTNLMTGPKVAQVYIKLSWPARMNPTNAGAGTYEILTYIPLP